MKDGTGAFQQCYNAQIAVDDSEQIVVAAEVGQNAADNSRLVPMVDQAIARTDQEPGTVLADAGYRSEANFALLEQRGIRAVISLGREGKRKTIGPGFPATRRMQRRLKTSGGRTKYRKRKHIVEPPIGWIKAVLGFRAFSLRGLSKVRGEWQLVTLALNLRRMSERIAWS